LRDTFDFIILAPGGEFFRKYKTMGFRVYQLYPSSFFANVKRIKSVIQKENPKFCIATAPELLFGQDWQYLD
jgi:hypothetical protein